MGRRVGGVIPVPDRAEMKRLYITENKTMQQLADHYKVSKSKITVWLQDLEITKKPGRSQRKITDDEYVKIYNEYHKSKQTYREFGAKYGLNASAMWHRVLMGEIIINDRKRAEKREREK